MGLLEDKITFLSNELVGETTPIPADANHLYELNSKYYENLAGSNVWHVYPGQSVQAAVDAAAARYQELYIMQGVDCMPGNYTSEDLVIPEGVVLYARYPGTVSAGAITLNGGTVYDIYDDVSGIQYSALNALTDGAVLGLFGYGGDNAGSITADVVLNRSRAYSALTITAGHTLTVNGHIIRVNGDFILNGTILDWAPSDGKNGNAAIGSVAGAAKTIGAGTLGYAEFGFNYNDATAVPSVGATGTTGAGAAPGGAGSQSRFAYSALGFGGDGGKGGDTTSTGQTPAPSKAPFVRPGFPLQTQYQRDDSAGVYNVWGGCPGGAGASGSGDGIYAGGGGGGGAFGGGIICIYAKRLVIGVNALFCASGGTGGAGGNAAGGNANGGAGGGGGGGGVVYIIAGEIDDSAIDGGIISAIDIAGGAGGAGGTKAGSGVVGGAGSTGTAGHYYIYNLKTGVWRYA